MLATENYNLDLYEANDPANLLDGYNDAMGKIDTALKTNADASQTAQSAAKKVQSAIDAITPFDTTPTLNSEKGVTSGGIRAYVNTEVTKLDSELHEDSTTIFGKSAYTDFDTAVTTDSINLITSGAVASALSSVSKTYKKAVIIGDSWSEANNNSTTKQHETYGPEYRMFIDIFKLSTSNIYFNASGGGGYVTSGEYGTFKTRADAITSDWEDADVVTILGGQNDNGTEIDTEATAVVSTINAIRAKCPNAEIHVFVMPLAIRAITSAYYNVYNGIIKGVNQAGDSNTYMHTGLSRAGVLLYNFVGGNGDTHLNNDGYTMLKFYLAQAIINGGPCILPNAQFVYTVNQQSNNWNYVSQNIYAEDAYGNVTIQFTGETKSSFAATWQWASLPIGTIIGDRYFIGPHGYACCASGANLVVTDGPIPAGVFACNLGFNVFSF